MSDNKKLINLYYKSIKFQTNKKISTFPMRKRINFDLLKKNQLRAQYLKNPLQQSLYSASYQLVNDLLSDIKRPFKNICIHGFYQPMMIDYLTKHREQFINTANNQNTNTTEQQKPKLTIVDYLGLQEAKFYQNQIFQTRVVQVENNDAFLPEENQFDLVISGLQLNHTNNEEIMLEKYLRTLKPDGALIGCAMVQGTLSQLHWSYLMAQNERYGGLSPKILNFPSLGQLGNHLTATHYHLATVLSRDFHLEFDSPLDVLRAIEIIGESGHLRGRRKAVYKELLVSMYALYQSEFSLMDQQEKSEKVLSTVVLSPFVGWKFSPDQPKPLRRGQHGESIDFIDQLRKYDPDLEHYRISEDSEQPQQINKQKKGEVKDNKNNKDE